MRPAASRRPTSPKRTSRNTIWIGSWPKSAKQGILNGMARNPTIERLYPLSPMQQGMLFHSLLDAASGVYVTQLAFTLAGVNVAALRAAWERVVRHHDVLRTLFVWQ